jgi:vacuolar-type H+-ATPase subunit H
MINDIIEEIKKVEFEAEAMIAGALENGRAIVLDAVFAAEKIRTGAVESVKAERVKKNAKTAQAVEFIKGKVFSVNR